MEVYHIPLILARGFIDAISIGNNSFEKIAKMLQYPLSDQNDFEIIISQSQGW
jgi:hypothetical protein